MNSRTVSEAYSAKIGFTGKIPDCPDFISRFLPPSFTSYWNGWVDEGMQHSQRLLGKEWRQAFLVSPVWHFSILPGVLGDTGWLGVVIPSVDKAGRYYPLTVASPLFFERHHNLESDAIQERLEAIAIAALDEGSTSLELEALCQEELLSQSETLILRSPERNVTDPSPACSIKLHRNQAESTLSVSGHAAESFLKAGACFWSSGSPFLQAAAHYFESLPEAAFFVSMLKDDKPLPGSNISFIHHNPLESKQDLPVTMDLPQKQRAWISEGRTNPGQRSINQDAYVQLPDLGMWAVADGMGGHAQGERASQLVVELLCQLPKGRYLETLLGRVIKSLTIANEELQLVSQQELGGQVTGTTFVGFITDGTNAFVVWVGDSRIYRLRRGELELLTVDHTCVTTQGRSALSRAVGGGQRLEVDSRFISIDPDDQFLLCSDGLYRSVTEQEMASLLVPGDLNQKADALMDLALKREAKDNVSLIVLKRNDGAGVAA